MKANQLGAFDLSTIGTGKDGNIPLGKIENGVYTRLYEASNHPYLNRGKVGGPNNRGSLGGSPEVRGGQKAGGGTVAKPANTTPTGGTVSKAARDINTKLVERGVQALPDEQLAKFTSITKKEQIQKVSDLMTTDLQKTTDMALGKENIPAGVNAQVLFNAVKNKAIADANVGVLMDLANSPLAAERSVAAQSLGAAGFDNGMGESDPVAAIQRVQIARTKAVTNRVKGIQKVITEDTGNIKAAVKKTKKRDSVQPRVGESVASRLPLDT